MFLLVVLLLALSAPAHAEQSGNLYQQAVELHKKGDLQGAVNLYKQVLKEHPDFVQARSNLGAALAALGYYDQAIAEYKEALKREASNPGVSFNLALAYYKTGEVPAAAKELETLHAIAPEMKQVTMLLADCNLRLGNNAKVIALLRPLKDKDPNDLAVVYMLGTALVRDNQLDEGQVLIDRILSKGDSAEAYLLLGTTKMQRGDFAGAIPDLAKAVELNPALPSANGYYGQALMQTGDTSKAMLVFRKEIELDPNDFNSNLSLGTLLKEDQGYDEAIQCLNRALRVRPGDFGALYQVATIRLAEGKLEEARKLLEDIVKQAPNFPEAHVSLATVYYRLKRKADGDRERSIVQKLNAENQEKQPGVTQTIGPEAGKAPATVPPQPVPAGEKRP